MKMIKPNIYVVGAENPGAQAKSPTLKKKLSTRLEIYEFTSRDSGHNWQMKLKKWKNGKP